MELALATIQRQRFTLHASRFSLHASRSTLHTPRFTLHASLPSQGSWRGPGVGGEASLSLLTICKDKSFHC